MSGTSVVIVGYGRTPFGGFFGGLKDVPAHTLGALAVNEVLRRTGVDPGDVSALYAGVAMASGGTFAPARETVLASQLPDTTASLAVDRACCSGMTAIGLAWKDLLLGHADLVICGGYDSLSRTPLWAPRARTNATGRAMATDPGMAPEDPLHTRSPVEPKTMAELAGAEALAHGVTRAMQDEWAAASHERYSRAEALGFFAAERFEVAGVSADEGPRTATAMPALAALPTIGASATVTAGNAAGPSDGAAFLMLATTVRAAQLGLNPLGRLVDYAQAAAVPASASSLPALAIRSLMKRQGRAMYEIDLLEINEDHAATALVSTLRLGSRHPELTAEIRRRTNVNGGAIAIGHPRGASGARVTLTLVNALTRRGGGRGLAAICGGYGQGEAVIVEVDPAGPGMA